MEEENIETVGYADLDENLKDQVKENFRNSDFLVPDDWWQWIVESISEKYSGININEQDLEFDIHRNSYNFEGNIDLNDAQFSKYLTDDYVKWDAAEWFSDFSTKFTNTELDYSVYINEDIIFDDLEAEFFGNKSLIVDEGQVSFPLNMIGDLSDAISKYGSMGVDVSFLKEMINAINAAQLFFQENAIVSAAEYDDFMSTITTDMKHKIEDDMGDIVDEINTELAAFYNDLKDDLINSYEYYYEDAYADEQLGDKIFDVIIDENGNQIEILDLNGN